MGWNDCWPSSGHGDTLLALQDDGSELPAALRALPSFCLTLRTPGGPGGGQPFRGTLRPQYLRQFSAETPLLKASID